MSESPAPQNADGTAYAERISNERLISATSDFISMLDGNYRYVLFNDALLQASGKKREELLGHPLWEFTGKEDFNRRLKPRLDRCLDGEAVTFEDWFVFPTKGARLMSIELSPWEDSPAGKRFVILTSHDITNLKLTEEALRRSEEKCRRIFETTRDAYIRIGMDGEIHEVNPAAARLLGHSTEDLVTLNLKSLINSDGTSWDALVSRLVDIGDIQGVEINLPGSDGDTICCDCNMRLVRSPENMPLAVEMAMRDISMRKRSENELTEHRTLLERRVLERTSQLNLANNMLHDKVYELSSTKQELSEYRLRLRELAAEMSLVEERERRRLALILHDGIIQDLAMARIRLSGLAERLRDTSHMRELTEVIGLIKDMISQSRSLVWEMGTPELYELGLEAALENLLEECQKRHGIEASCVREYEGRLPLPENAQIMLFQMVRELVTNVTKHANASKLLIRIALEKANLVLRVEDDGVGLPSHPSPLRQAPGSGFGLFSIRERLNLLDGGLDMHPKEGGGTVCVLTLPRNVLEGEQTP